MVAALAAAAMILTPAPPPAEAATGYTIGGGPWNVRDCSSTVCDVVGTIPDGAIPDLMCQAAGEEVYLGGNQRSAVWDKVRTPGGDVGFITDLAVLETTLGSFDSRLPRCSAAPGVVAHYRPRDGWWADRFDPVASPSIDIRQNEWSNFNCGPAFPEVSLDGKITTLAGWSLGRLGPTYVLQHAPARAASVDFIVLYDPGSWYDYFDQSEPASCDLNYDQSWLYRQWLERDPDNQLLILAGHQTRDEGSSHGLYGGIRLALFHEMGGTVAAEQVLVCRYDELDHPGVLREFDGVAAEGPRTSCPQADGVDFHGSFDGDDDPADSGGW